MSKLIIKRSDIDGVKQSLTSVAQYISDSVKHSDASMPIKDSEWTIGDAVAHLVISQRLFKKIINGTKSPYGDGDLSEFAKVNERLLGEFKDRNPLSLAKLVVQETDALLKEAQKHSVNFIVNTHFGDLTIDDCIRYSLCHLLIHGCDIALALNKDLPLERDHVVYIVPFLKKMMARVRGDKSAKTKISYGINIRGVDVFAIIYEGGNIKISNDIPGNVDCYISVHPIDFFLVSFGKSTILRSLLKGRIMVWGKKPWLALKLKTIFPNP